MVGGVRFLYVTNSRAGRIEVYDTNFNRVYFSEEPFDDDSIPRDFGEFSNRVLVGNFGNGQIAAFDGFDGRFIGFEKNPDDSVLSIDGLWSLTFGNSAVGCPATPPTGTTLPKCGSAGPYNTLFLPLVLTVKHTSYSAPSLR